MNLIEKIDNAPISELSKKEIKQELQKDYVMFDKPNVVSIKGRFDFTSLEHDMVNYFFLNFNNLDNENQITFRCIDIINTLKLKKSELNYDYIKQAFKNIRDKSIWWTIQKSNGDTEQFTFSFFDYVYCRTSKEIQNKKYANIDSTIKVRIGKENKEIIQQAIQNYFTTYNIIYIAELKNKYAKRIYEMLYGYSKSPSNKSNQFIMTIKSFREKLQIENKYLQNKILKRDVLDKAIKEINNKHNDFSIYYKMTKEHIVFLFENKDFGYVEQEAIQNAFDKVNALIKEKEQNELFYS